MSLVESYTDRGFAWVLLCASFLNLTLIAGTIRTFGILYAELLEVYDRGAGNTAFVGSLLFLTMALAGPFAGFITVHYSFKWCTIAGGVLACVGMATSSLTSNIEMLLVTYSIVMGFGLGLSTYPTVTLINFYFEKRRALANGILTSSLGLASLVYPVLYRKLIDKYGIHGTMLILGGILSNICVGGGFYRQPKCFLKHKMDSNSDNIAGRKTSVWFNFKQQTLNVLKTNFFILKNPSFLLYCVALSFALIAYSSNFNMLPPHIIRQHFTKDDAVITITSIGATELIARFISGHLLDLKKFTVQTMFIVTMFTGGLFAIAFPFFKSMAVNIIYGVTVGIFPGVFHSLVPLLMVSILGLKLLPSAIPLSSLFTNASSLIGHPFLGWLEDLTGNWNASFYTMGGLLIASSVFVLIERSLFKTKPSETIISTEFKEEQVEAEENMEHKHDTDEERIAMLRKPDSV